MSRWALIPVKDFERGKSRLSDVLPETERVELTRALFEHVVRVLGASPSIDSLAVVSDSIAARAYAEEIGSVGLCDAPGATGLADIVNAACKELEERGATSVLICMSDLPDLTIEDIESVCRELDAADVVLVPDLLHQGTNVIAVKPPRALPSCLGHDDSLARHLERARELGLDVSVQLRNGIGFDVDHPDDLAKLRRRQ